MCRDAKEVLSKADRIAEQLNTPLTALNIYPSHKGAETAPLLKAEGNVTLMALKPALNGGYIIRLFNPCDDESLARLTLPDVKHELTLRSMQVVTLLYKDGAVSECDLLDM